MPGMLRRLIEIAVAALVLRFQSATATSPFINRLPITAEVALLDTTKAGERNRSWPIAIAASLVTTTLSSELGIATLGARGRLSIQDIPNSNRIASTVRQLRPSTLRG